MATRQEALDAEAQRLAQVHKQFPEVDVQKTLAHQEKNINFQYDDTLGDETWDKMNAALSIHLEHDFRTGLAEARKYLDGHEDLEAKFDVIFGAISDETAAAAHSMMAENRNKDKAVQAEARSLSCVSAAG